MDAHDRQFLAHSHIDLVQLYLGDLVSHFGELAMFFADIYGGDKIAVVWKRQFLEPGPFKINLPYLATVSLDGKVFFLQSLISKQDSHHSFSSIYL